MAKLNIYQKYSEAANKANVSRNSKESIEWFRKRIRKDKAIKNLSVVREGLKSGRIEPGELVLYEYFPKYAKTLPFYDKYPLVLIIEKTSKGWSGLNLHYLSPTIRAKLLADIEYRRGRGLSLAKKFGESNFSRGSYRKYLSKQVKQRPVIVPKNEWEIAVQLPFENFVGATNKKAWKR